MIHRRLLLPSRFLLALTLAGALIGSAAVAATATVPDGHATPHPTSTVMPGMDHGAGSSDMPGMDHGAGSSDMPGMDHGADHGADHGDSPGTGHGDSPGTGHGEHGSTSDPTPDRPLGLVLGGFGAGSAAVLAAAALIRRRDHAAAVAKQAHLGARAAQP